MQLSQDIKVLWSCHGWERSQCKWENSGFILWPISNRVCKRPLAQTLPKLSVVDTQHMSGHAAHDTHLWVCWREKRVFPPFFPLYFLQAGVWCQAYLQSSALGSWEFCCTRLTVLCSWDSQSFYALPSLSFVPRILTSSSWPVPTIVWNHPEKSGHRQWEIQLIAYVLL